MKRFEAPTLEEAYALAGKEFSCSITELEIQVVQHPSRGFLGFGRKPAVIVAHCPAQKGHSRQAAAEASEKGGIPASGSSSEPAPRKEGTAAGRDKKESRRQEAIDRAVNAASEAPKSQEEATEAACEASRKDPTPPSRASRGKEQEIFENFYNEKPDIGALVPEVEDRLNRLFQEACFDLEAVRVSVYDEETLMIEFNGADAALLIGREGYRYKALAHLLYNWIHSTYGVRMRLEIAEFLQNQEMMIENYLQPIVERVRNEGRAQTKVLDGILVQIALKRLREIFPDKYVAIRSNREGGRYIIVNEFLEKR